MLALRRDYDFLGMTPCFALGREMSANRNLHATAVLILCNPLHCFFCIPGRRRTRCARVGWPEQAGLLISVSSILTKVSVACTPPYVVRRSALARIFGGCAASALVCSVVERPMGPKIGRIREILRNGHEDYECVRILARVLSR